MTHKKSSSLPATPRSPDMDQVSETTENDRAESASKRPENPQSVSASSSSNIENPDEYKEFLITQHFFRDTDTFASTDKHPDHDAQKRNISTPSDSESSPPGSDDDHVEWKVGDIIDSRYEVKDIIGKGGMGIVYRVYHREWDVDLAVKMPLKHLVANQALKARFTREAQTWIDLGLHPNIVQCWYVREFGGIPRVFMDYMVGGSLKDWMKTGKVQPGNWDPILDVIIQACDGLGYAHEHGIKSHRDVKPANLLLDETGELRVTDFGIAKRSDIGDEDEQNVAISVDGKQHTITVTGTDVGTPEYGAPEQWGEARYADARADVYALGGVLFELCCGRRAFDDGQHQEQPYALIGRHLFSPAPDPRSFNHDIPAALAHIILQCLAKEPDQRPNSMRELRELLVEQYVQIVGTSYWKAVPQAAELRSSTLNNRAISLVDLGKVTEALAAFDEALKLDAHHPESVYNKALLEWREVRIADDEVVRRLKEARQVSHQAGVYLGIVHLERGAVEEAERVFTHVLQDPKLKQESSIWKGLGDACIAQEKYDQAQQAYQHALDLFPDDPLLKERRSLALQKTRRQDGHIIVPYPHCLRTFTGLRDRPEAMMLSPDARFALTVHSEGAKLWNLASGKFFWSYTWSEEGQGVWMFKGYAGSHTHVAITPDAQFALSGGSDDRIIRMWNLETGRCINRLVGHDRAVSALTILPDGQHALSGSLDSTLCLWELSTGSCRRTFEGFQEPITTLNITPDGQHALVGSANMLRQMDLVNGKIVRTYRGHGDVVTAIAVDPTHQTAVSGSRDKTVRLWTLISGRCLKTFTGHTNAVTAVALTPDGSLAISASLDKSLRVWDLKEGSCVNILQGHTSHVTTVVVTPDGQFAFSVSRDGTMRLWRLATGKCLRVFQEFSHWLEALVLTPDGRSALFGNQEELRLKHLPSQTYRHILTTCSSSSQDGLNTGLSESSKKALTLQNLPPGENFFTVIGRKEETTFTIATPDGHLGISGGPDETLTVWDVSPERKHRLWGLRGTRGLQVFKSHRSVFRAVTTTPDGRFVLSGGEDGIARVWELSTGRCIQELEGHRGSINAVALTPDARFLLTGSTDTTLRLWDREMGNCLKVLRGHDSSVTAVSMTPEGQFAVSGSSDKSLRLWDLTLGTCLRTFEEYTDMVIAVAMTPDAQYALAATNTHALRLWRLDARVPRQRATFQVCRHLGHQELEVFRKRFRRFLSRAEDARQAGNIATAYTFLTLARAIPGYERDPDAIALNALLNTHLEKKSLKGGRLLHTITGHEKTITALATTLDGRFILSGSHDKTLRIWGLATGQHLRTFEGHTDHVTCVAVTPDRHLAITGSRDKTLRLWALATGECLKILTGHTEYVSSVAVSFNGRFAVSGSRDHTVRLWSLVTEEHHDLFEGLQIPVEDAYISAERATDRSLRIFKGHSDAVEAVAISSNGRLIISGGQDTTVRLWDLSSGRCTRIFRGHSGYITAVALSWNGQFAVSASRDKTLRVWRINTGTCARILRGHEAYISSVAISSDGQFAVSGSWDRTLRLWNLSTGECMWVFEPHDAEIEAIAFTTDGHWVVSGDRNATLRVWEFDWELSLKK